MKLPEPNNSQAAFLWLVGIVALLGAINEAVKDFDGHPLWPSLIAITAIFVALNRRTSA